MPVVGLVRGVSRAVVALRRGAGGAQGGAADSARQSAGGGEGGAAGEAARAMEGASAPPLPESPGSGGTSDSDSSDFQDADDDATGVTAAAGLAAASAVGPVAAAAVVPASTGMSGGATVVVSGGTTVVVSGGATVVEAVAAQAAAEAAAAQVAADAVTAEAVAVAIAAEAAEEEAAAVAINAQAAAAAAAGAPPEGDAVAVPVAEPAVPIDVPLEAHRPPPVVIAEPASASVTSSQPQLTVSPSRAVQRMREVNALLELRRESRADLCERTAKRTASNHTPRKPNGDLFPIIGTGVGALGAIFGPGVGVWMHSTRFFGQLFLFLSLLSAFALYYSARHALADEEAHQGYSNLLAIFGLSPLQLSNVGGNLWDAGWDVRALMTLIVSLDVGCVLILLIAVTWLNGRHQRVEEEADMSAITLDDYTVQVFGLLHDVNMHAVKEWFARFGKVHIVYQAPDISKTMALRARLARQLRKAARADAVGDVKTRRRSRSRAADLHTTITRRDKSSGDGIVATFVTFEEEAAAVRCRAALPAGRLACFTADKLLFSAGPGEPEYNIHAKRAPPPNDIIWENLACGGFQRFLRASFGYLVMAILLLLSIAATTATKDKLLSLSPEVSCPTITTDVKGALLQCEAVWPLNKADELGGDARDAVRGAMQQYLDQAPGAEDCSNFVYLRRFTYDIAQHAPFTPAPSDPNGDWGGGFITDGLADECAARVCFSCYCQSAGFMAWRNDKGDQDLRPFCDAYWEDQALFLSLTAMVLIVVLVVNQILLLASHAMGDFERFHTVTERDNAVAIKLGMALLFNTAVVPVLTYAYISELEDVPLLFSGTHEDTHAPWHDIVITAIVTSAIINALAFPLAYVGEVLFTKCWRCCCKGGAKTQHDLNELYRPPKFALAERTGQFLSVVFYTLMLSSGAPLLWPVVCMYCILQYLVDKRLLLRSTQQPPRYSGKLASMMRLVLPWAGVLHLSVSVWMYGHAALPSYDVGGEMCEAVRENRIDRETSAEQDLMMDTFGLQGDDQFDFEVRLCRLNALIPAFACALLIAVLVASYIGIFFGSALESVCHWCGLCNQRQTVQGCPPLSRALERRQVTGHQSYEIAECPEYKDLFLGQVFSAIDQAVEEQQHAPDKARA